MVNFSLRSRDFGLTFADARETTKEEVYSSLQLITIGGRIVDRLMLCEEVGHMTGRRHYHAYIRFSAKVSANEFSFDVHGLHPHIDRVRRRGTRSIEPMLRYLTKEDEHPLSTFDWRPMLEENQSNENNKRKQPDWDQYYLEGLTQGEVLQRLADDGFSNEFANHYFNWNGYIKRRFIEDRRQPYVNDGLLLPWKLPETLAIWHMSCFEGWFTWCATNNAWERPRSLVLVGPSRSGKTQWARSLGHHMYFNNLINLDDWDETAQYIILDDFASDITKYFPCWKCFFGGQKEFVLTDKYRGKKRVHWGKPMIWLSNEDIFTNLKLEHINFIKANCEVVVLNKKLY